MMKTELDDLDIEKLWEEFRNFICTNSPYRHGNNGFEITHFKQFMYERSIEDTDDLKTIFVIWVNLGFIRRDCTDYDDDWIIDPDYRLPL